MGHIRSKSWIKDDGVIWHVVWNPTLENCLINSLFCLQKWNRIRPRYFCNKMIMIINLTRKKTSFSVKFMKSMTTNESRLWHLYLTKLCSLLKSAAKLSILVISIDWAEFKQPETSLLRHYKIWRILWVLIFPLFWILVKFPTLIFNF